MGVPIDRGLTPFFSASSRTFSAVEMGVPIDRGLTHHSGKISFNRFFRVEMGVPIDRGLTHPDIF